MVGVHDSTGVTTLPPEKSVVGVVGVSFVFNGLAPRALDSEEKNFSLVRARI